MTNEDVSLIDSLLATKGFNLNSLNFEKDWASSVKFKLPAVLKVLDEPLFFPMLVDSTKQLLDNSTFPMKDFCDFISDSAKENFDLPSLLSDASPNDIFDFVKSIWAKAFLHQQNAFISLSTQDKEKLIFLSYDLHKEGRDNYDEFYKKNNITKYDEIDSDELISLIAKIDFDELFKAALITAKGYNYLIDFFHNNTLKFTGKYEENTRFGKFIINGTDDDSYKDAYAFILDLGGNDSYFSNFSTSLYQPFLWQIDLSGNDLYHNSSLGEMFRASFGFLYRSDFSGDDQYFGGDYMFSAWAGCFISYDDDGDDYYKGGLHSLGAATMGIALLKDSQGDDIYSGTEFAQGFASILAIGILSDMRGDDVYYCGGKYLHDPLAPHDYRTMSHGYGFGLRPDIAGGIGILYDKSGNDYYNGGVFSIGGAYWYALGIVIDLDGNDAYNSVYYPQGSGIHLAGGFLLDENGEDNYYSKHGPGQGAGHDYSVGFLIDKNGNDSYSVEGGIGLGLTNSVGIFIDGDGDDKYATKYPKICGYANKSRGSGGIGIFIDKNGKDEYSNDFAKNDTIWQRGYFGFGLDISNEKEKIIEKKEIAEAKIDSLLPIKQIFKIASGWGVNSNKKRVDRAMEILLSRDEEAAKYISQNVMDTKSGLTYRAIKNFTKKSNEMKKYFPKLIDSADTLIAKNTISLIGELKDSTYIAKFDTLLSQKKYEKSVLSSLGKIKSDESVKLLSKYIDSKSEIYRVIVARGLFKIDTPLAKRYLKEMEKDESFLIKAMFIINNEKKDKK